MCTEIEVSAESQADSDEKNTVLTNIRGYVTCRLFSSLMCLLGLANSMQELPEATRSVVSQCARMAVAWTIHVKKRLT